jgi:hypothetical protein
VAGTHRDNVACSQLPSCHIQMALWCRVQVHLYSLGDLAYLGRVLVPGDDAATALAFTPDGAQLAVATAGKAVHVFDVAARTPAAWASANGASLQGSLDKVPGPILGLSFDPTPKVRLDDSLAL